MSTITNPILRGFNPDPSIIRVGEDYYIATSTFEWFPGVQIHHSRDLSNWELVGRPLSRLSQLDMKGVPDSCGVWAPCLSYDKGFFYLVYSNVKSFAGVWKDTPNYLVTATDIRGEWSDPVRLSSRGFDGSLFHDEDGRKWYLSMVTDHRRGVMFGGIVLQEYDTSRQKLTGPAVPIFRGSALGLTEGPHLYKKDGYYYLLTAEGGTEYGHAATMARSRDIQGPYIESPYAPFISSRDCPDFYLQKSGHADLVQTPTGEWLTVFLCARPLAPQGRCILGRETALEMVSWPENEWPRLKSGMAAPRIVVPLEEGPDVKKDCEGMSDERRNVVDGLNGKRLGDRKAADGKEPLYFFRDDFDGEQIDVSFQSLRVPITGDWAGLKDKPGYLTLYGRESLSSIHEQSLLARRIQHPAMEVSTLLEFQPEHFQQMAGLVCYYNTAHFHYLHVSADDAGRRVLQIITHDHFYQREALEEPVLLPDNGAVYLQAVWEGAALQFYYALKEHEWKAIGRVLDASILSDDYVREGGTRYRPAFTGAFVGLCCQDLSGQRMAAHFDWFSYQEKEYEFSPLIKKELPCISPIAGRV